MKLYKYKNKIFLAVISVMMLSFIVLKTEIVNLEKYGSSGVIFFVFNNLSFDFKDESSAGKWISFPNIENHQISSRFGGIIVNIRFGSDSVNSLRDSIKLQKKAAGKWYDSDKGIWFGASDCYAPN